MFLLFLQHSYYYSIFYFLYFCLFVFDVSVCPLGRRYFIKNAVTSCSKCEITYRFSKTLENTYEGVQFSEVTGLQPATLLKIDSFIDMKQRFHRCIHRYLPHSFNLFDKPRQLFIFK